MVGVEWADGKQSWCDTWDELFNTVRDAQWSHLDDQMFRSEMAKRAMRWSRTQIDPWLPAGKFFKELERAHMLVVIGTIEERS